jgi:hypothetical protein
MLKHLSFEVAETKRRRICSENVIAWVSRSTIRLRLGLHNEVEKSKNLSGKYPS